MREKERLIEEKESVLKQKEEETRELEQKVNEAFKEVVALAKENNPEFISRFMEVYPDFYSRLLDMDPNLQASELHFCAMLFLNFSTKEIAAYTYVTPKAVQTRKYRLRKKFDIPSDKDISLWLRELDNK
ncbi:helix-turn-helix transcriptional regulator [Sinomicrobium weinanense]|uniref:HTH luxR-type domain-containing protein n=1 Tax=Sinomicrobium weinanense TaxID=2842200 RepID=A0A926Q117_9FLAO|nr:hypothetical protein [Sinomicrobium weinanense]MBC9795263.1 hypothetical protein [Sinomicrobium weinanense]MBU3125735.1 hypothetical protein [Sinomicrobium weinanense]